MYNEYALASFSTASSRSVQSVFIIFRNTQIIHTCIVFPQWHIRSNASFILSFFAIVALGVFYEWLRGLQRTVDQRIAIKLSQGTKGKARGGFAVSARASPSPEREDTELLTGRRAIKTALCV